jgi:hypothetical protein
VAIDKEASRRWRRRIREVLNSKWDPIGVAAAVPDEYDAYVGKVAAVLREGASDDELFRYLHRVETAHIGMPGNEDRLRDVIRSIRVIGFMN